jgi:phosphoribosylformylglycinamidine synthase
MRVRVLVRLKPGIMDVQGTAIQKALAGLGFADVGDLRVGKVIELTVPGESLTAVHGRIEEMCRKLLVNPVLEDWTVEAVPDLVARGAGR